MREMVLALVVWMIAGPPLAAEPAHWRLGGRRPTSPTAA